MRYAVIYIMSAVMEIGSTFYIRFVSDRNSVGMIFFAFIGPFLGLPFVGYIVDTKTWSERVKMAFYSAFGYVTGTSIVIYLIDKK
jgi:hypothetical protein